MRENDKKNMIITIDGSYLDDELRGKKLKFEGTGFGHDNGGYVIFADSSVDYLRQNSISVEALEYLVEPKIKRGDLHFQDDVLLLYFVKGTISFNSQALLEEVLEYVDTSSFDLLVQRERGTNNRIYHKGDSSMLKMIGVKIKIPKKKKIRYADPAEGYW